MHSQSEELGQGKCRLPFYLHGRGLSIMVKDRTTSSWLKLFIKVELEFRIHFYKHNNGYASQSLAIVSHIANNTQVIKY